MFYTFGSNKQTMTLQEKQRKVERLHKRIKRYYDLVDYYNFSDINRKMICCFKGIVMQHNLITLMSTPTDEMRVDSFDKGGITLIQ